MRRPVCNYLQFFSIVRFSFHLYSGSFIIIYSMPLRRGLFLWQPDLTNFDNTPCSIMSNESTRFVFKPNFTIEACHMTFSIQYFTIGYLVNPTAYLGHDRHLLERHKSNVAKSFAFFYQYVCGRTTETKMETTVATTLKRYNTRWTSAQWARIMLTESP